MPDISIRRLVGDDIVQYYAPMHQYAFYATPPVDIERYANRYEAYEGSLVLGAFEDEQNSRYDSRLNDDPKYTRENHADGGYCRNR